MAAGNPSFDKLATSTLRNFPTEVLDSVSTNNALFFLLNKAGNLKVTAGGREFTHPIRYKLNNTFQARAHLQTIATDLQDDITRAVYPQKSLSGSLVLSKWELAQNKGNREKLIDLVIEAKNGAKVSMSELMGNQVWKDGSVSADFDGLQFLINAAPSGQSDVGGIDASASGNEYWQNKIDDVEVSAFNTSQAGLAAMNALLLAATFGAQGPRAVLTTKAIFSLYELGLTSNIRYTSTNIMADSKFMHLVYATMPVLFDDNAVANKLYMIDTDNLWLQVLSGANMETTPFESSHNQLSLIALMWVVAQITTGSRRTQAVHNNITG